MGTTTSPVSSGGAGATAPAGLAGTTAPAVAGTTAPAAGGGGATAAVSGAGGAAAGGAGGAAASGPVTFTKIYDDIFVPGGCAAGGRCHGGPGGGKLDLIDKETAYKNLVGVMAMGMSEPQPPTPHCVNSGLMRVKAGEPANSLLFEKISKETPKCGNMMPPGGLLEPAQVDMVKAWIMAGAKND